MIPNTYRFILTIGIIAHALQLGCSPKPSDESSSNSQSPRSQSETAVAQDLYFDCDSPKNEAGDAENYFSNLQIRLDGHDRNENLYSTGRVESSIGYGEFYTDENDINLEKNERTYHLDWGGENGKEYHLIMPLNAHELTTFTIVNHRLTFGEPSGEWKYDCRRIEIHKSISVAELTALKAEIEKLETPFSLSGTEVKTEVLKSLSTDDAWKQKKYMARIYDEKTNSLKVTLAGNSYLAISMSGDQASELHLFTANGEFIATLTSSTKNPTLTWRE